jgi:F0F1-type ATP synthase gamma subunit
VDEIFSLFVSEEVDKVELLYTKFVSLIKSEPVIHTILPLSPQVKLLAVSKHLQGSRCLQLLWGALYSNMRKLCSYLTR